MTLLLDTRFLEQLIKDYKESFFDVTKKNVLSKNKYYGNIIDLIHGSKRVYTIDSPSNEKIQQDPLLMHLLKKDVLRRIDMSNMRSELQVKCYNDFLLIFISENSDINLDETPESAGIFFLNSLKVNKDIFTSSYITYNIDSEWNMEICEKLLYPHHSMVIADPYLYTEIGKRGLFTLISNQRRIKLKVPYHLTLIGKDNSLPLNNKLFDKKKIRNVGKELFDHLLMNGASEGSIVETFINNDKEFHDRYLLTNNIAIFPGFGIGIINKPNVRVFKEGTWSSERPFNRINMNQDSNVLFERLMRQKLRIFAGWCKKRSENRLLKEFLDENIK